MKKLVVFISFFILLIIAFVIIKNIPKNYKLEYKINNINVTESYDKDNRIYHFIFKKGNSKYEYYLNSNHFSNRRLINKIKIKNNCISIESKYIKNYKVCKNKNNYYSKYYNDIDKSKKVDSYKKINIYNLNDKTYFIWNYNNLILISKDSNKTIKLFSTDYYNINLATIIKDYLFVPNYDQNEYSFDEYYLIDKNGKINKKKLDRKIYFDSYILGTDKDYIYLYDNQENVEYEINPFKEETDKIPFQIMKDSIWEKTSQIKLEKGQKFTLNSNFYFYLNDNQLMYKQYKLDIKITSLKVDNIIKKDENSVYFVSNDTLYYFSGDSGITKLLSYSEWKFNNNNIYIF